MKALPLFFALLPCFLGALSISADTYTIVVPTGYSLIANHLNRGSNTVVEVLGTVPDGTVFTKWNPTTQSYGPSNTFRLMMGGWVLPLQTLLPGEGAWLENPGSPFPLTLTGSSASPALPVVLSGELSLVGRQKIGPGTFEQITGRAPTPNTVVYQYRDGTGWIISSYWMDLGWIPAPLLVPTGEAVFVRCGDCPSLAPRPPELLSFLPTDGSTNARDASVVLRMSDPDAQVVPLAAWLDGAILSAPVITAPAPEERAFTWQPLLPLAVGSHSAEVSHQTAAFNGYDFNIPAQHFTNSVNFSVETRPFTLLYILPADGSTNPANEKLTFRFSDPDSQLNLNSIATRLDGAVLTNMHIWAEVGFVLGFYTPSPPLAGGTHTFELTYNDVAALPVSYTNRVAFYSRPPPQIHASWSGGNLTLTWEGVAVLQESENLVDWTYLKAATSPYLTTAACRRKFFRVRE